LTDEVIWLRVDVASELRPGVTKVHYAAAVVQSVRRPFDASWVSAGRDRCGSLTPIRPVDLPALRICHHDALTDERE
jgi:hypothetical protein